MTVIDIRDDFDFRRYLPRFLTRNIKLGMQFREKLETRHGTAAEREKGRAPAGNECRGRKIGQISFKLLAPTTDLT